MLIDCSRCGSKVDANQIAEISDYNEDGGFPSRFCFLQCPVCNGPILAYQELENIGPKLDDWDFGAAIRLWPEPDEVLHHALPKLVKASIEEAEKCYHAGAYYACAVMCGRAIEGVCSEYKVKNKSFAGGLKELLEKGFIDEKLYKWSEALRKHRNIAAHASEEKITKEDAADLIDFAKAISNYIYVLTYKFNDFMSRTKKS